LRAASHEERKKVFEELKRKAVSRLQNKGMMFFNGMVTLRDFAARITLDNHLIASIKQFSELSQEQSDMMKSLEKVYSDFGQIDLDYLVK
jgi:predicted transcriptional regulator